MIVVFHKDCKASTDFIVLVSKLQGFDIDYIDIKSEILNFSDQETVSKEDCL
jgi:hypothetical protein